MKLVEYNKSHKKDFKKVYKSSFPKNERKPFLMLTRAVRNGDAEMLVAQENDTFVGIVVTFVHESIVLVDYLAIDEKYRGGGYGSKILQLLKDRYADKTLFLEIEYPNINATNNVDRLRRKFFYMENKLMPLDYHIKLFGIHMELLYSNSSNQKPTWEEIENFYNYIYGKLITKFISKMENTFFQTFELPMELVHPTQLYINSEKLSRLENQNLNELPPIPVKVYNGKIYATDGHTRAVLNYLAGGETLKCVLDTDDISDRLYLLCIEECEKRGITTIHRLSENIISDSQYQTDWVDWCEQLKLSKS